MQDGSTLDALEPGWAPGLMPSLCFDACLYSENRSPLASVMLRAADDAGDADLRARGAVLADFALDTLAASPQPLNKGMGELLTRLHPAIARLNPIDDIFGNGFQ